MTFADAMIQAGVYPPLEIIADGRMRRFRLEGDNSRNKNGWYVLFDDPSAGAFGCWKRGIKETWHENREVNAEEREAFRRKMEEAKARRIAEEKKRQAQQLAKAAWIWKKAQPVSRHPYLEKKGVKAQPGIKGYRDSIVIPLRNGNGEIRGLQFIKGDGEKTFLSGSDKKGSYFPMGRIEDGPLCVAEGFATAASIRECTGFPVAVAFDAGNLCPVVQVLRRKYPDHEMIICADNDASGVGKEKGGIAAVTCRGKMVMPPEVGMDFNDYHRERGVLAVRRLICGSGSGLGL